MAHHVLPWMGASGPVFTLSSEVEHVAFDLDGVKGRYTALYPRVELLSSGWITGVLVPVIDLHRDGMEAERGFGNPRIYGQATIWRPLGLSAGVEVDLPWGEDEVAGDHAEVIPFLSIEQMGSEWGAFGSIGFRESLGSSHSHAPSRADLAEGFSAGGTTVLQDAGHAHDPGHDDDAGHDDDPDHEASHNDGHRHSTVHPVDPHSDRELLYRVGIARAWGTSSIRAYLDGQSVLEDISGPKQFMTAGLELGIPAFGLLWSPGIEVPIGPDRRLDSSIQLGVHALF